MAEHLHGYPPCEARAGQPCSESDLNFEECKSHGALESCSPSVVDGMPTGLYRCTHRDAMAATRRAATKKMPAKKAAKKAARKVAKAKPKKVAAKSAKTKTKPKKAARKGKPAKKAKARKAGKKK